MTPAPGEAGRVDPDWVTVGRHDDPEDAEWEVARLAEADIPAATADPAEPDGPVEVRVPAGYADRARQLLAQDDAADETAADDEPADPDPGPAVTEGYRLAEQAVTFCVVGAFVPPLAVYGLWLGARAVGRREPQGIAGGLYLGLGGVIAGVSLAVWGDVLFG